LPYYKSAGLSRKGKRLSALNKAIRQTPCFYRHITKKTPPDGGVTLTTTTKNQRNWMKYRKTTTFYAIKDEEVADHSKTKYTKSVI